jgi:hypothetical protein
MVLLLRFYLLPLVADTNIDLWNSNRDRSRISKLSGTLQNLFYGAVTEIHLGAEGNSTLTLPMVVVVAFMQRSIVELLIFTENLSLQKSFTAK